MYQADFRKLAACFSRTFLSIISGVVAGIWGFNGLMGFVVYLLVMMVTSLGLLVKAKFSVDCWNRILIEGVTGGLMVRLARANGVIHLYIC